MTREVANTSIVGKEDSCLGTTHQGGESGGDEAQGRRCRRLKLRSNPGDERGEWFFHGSVVDFL